MSQPVDYRAHHEFDADQMERLIARPEPTVAQWRCAAAEIIAKQHRRRALTVSELIDAAAVLAEWLESGTR